MYLAISSEVRFTHDLPMVAKLVTAYCVAIRHLLLNAEDPNRRKGAFDAAKESAQESKCNETLQYLDLAEKFSNEKEVILNEAFNPHNGSIVHSKNGFVLSFYFLLREDIPDSELFDETMKECCRLGGDTDTNAAIAGALIGAFLGHKRLPKEKVKKIMTSDCKSFWEPRPEWLLPSKLEIYKMIDELVDMAPTQFVIKNGPIGSPTKSMTMMSPKVRK